METLNLDVNATGPDVLHKAERLFAESQDVVHQRTDRLFVKLMVFQWLAGIAAALWISPLTWIGAASQLHWHVWAAIFLGGAIAALPIFLVWKQPGTVLTRHVIAVSQMLTSALLIHLTGGRIETHFHVFGSLAFLAFYRDWKVIVTATVVVAADHFLRGVFWPQSVFGVLTASHWRWVEHAGWVIFEDTFLLILIHQSLSDMWEVCVRRSKLEEVNSVIEAEVVARTKDLVEAHQSAAREASRFEFIFSSIPVGITWMIQDTPETRLVNPAHARITGVPLDRCHELDLYRLATHPDDRGKQDALHRQLVAGQINQYTCEKRYVHPDGAVRWTALTVRHSPDPATGKIQEVCTLVDITERKETEAMLERVHKDLLEASRRAGMTEVATSVLHNVGNVLNSVNVSATLVSDQVRTSKVANLAKVNALLEAHEADLADFLAHNPQGQLIRGYLSSLADHLTAEQGSMMKELESLRKNMEHIKEIVTMQQNYSKVYGVAETLPLVDLVEDALRMNAGAFARHDVTLIRDFQARPTVTLEKHKVLQILVNLMRNAKYACDESGRTDKQMKVSILNGNNMIKIAVSDNGVGIPRENLARIFSHGFTTRKDGHGYGLHSGALAAKDIGGSLTAQSDGPGLGATFVLELPFKQEGIHHE